MTRAVEAEHVEGVGEAVKAERAGDRDDVPPIDEPPAEALLGLTVLVEMHAGGVLIEARRHLVFGLFDGLAVHVIDLVADRIVFPAAGGAGQRIIVDCELQRRQRFAERVGRDALVELRNDSFRRGQIEIALHDHDPAREGQNRIAVLVAARGAHIDRAVLAARVLLDADHFRRRCDRVAGIDRCEKAELRVTEIGDGVARDIRHRLSDHEMKHEDVVDGRARIADALRERVRRLHGDAAAIQSRIDADVADRDGPWRRVDDLLPDFEILEIVSGDRAVDFVCVGHCVGVAIFNPMMEPISVAMKKSRKAVAGSL